MKTTISERAIIQLYDERIETFEEVLVLLNDPNWNRKMLIIHLNNRVLETEIKKSDVTNK